MTQQDQTNGNIHQSGRAAIYARPATGARTKTTQQQTNTLIELANELGYPNERIIVYEDAGVSVREPLVVCRALSDLLTTLMQPERAEEPIQAIFVFSEDRLFNGLNTVGCARFIEMCKERSVTLRTPTSEYDFANAAHVALFGRPCINAADASAQAGKIAQRTAGPRKATKKGQH